MNSIRKKSFIHIKYKFKDRTNEILNELKNNKKMIIYKLPFYKKNIIKSIL